MKPYYEEAGIQIFHGDCREILPCLPKADLVLTDPPYGIDKDGQKPSTGAHGGRKAYEFGGWDAERPPKEAFDLLRVASRNQIIWGGNYFADLLPATAGWLVWDKGQRINQSDGELAWTSFDRALRIAMFNRVELMLDGAYYPTQKPIALMKWCISLVPDARAVLDPFCGSGSTLRAAKDMGLNAVGIDRREQACEIAANRLRQQVLAFA